MTFETPKIAYNGKIREIALGKEKQVTVGGETCYPFYLFEGDMPRRPVIAMDVYDTKPDEWPQSIVKLFEDVLDDPPSWAKKCVESYGAEMITLQLVSTDPNGLNASPEQAVEVTKKVAESIDVPLVVWGVANSEKDTVVLKMIAEACSGMNLILGPVEEDVHKAVGAAAIAYGHTVAASTPIDINLAKQLNILLKNLGLSDERILIDPTVSSLGYGLEYCYSVMERIRMAALTQEDERLQFPILANLAKEVWKIKEIKLTQEEDPLLGEQEKRGILLEAMTAELFLIAGADILVMRHPGAIELVRKFVDELTAA